MGWSETEPNFPVVGREAQISLIQKQLASLWHKQDSPPASLLLYFYGMRGLGKTRLLETVEAFVLEDAPGPNFICLFIKQPAPPSTPINGNAETAHYRSFEDINAFFNDFYQQFKQTAPAYTLIEYERLLANRTHLRDEEGLWLRAKTLASDLIRLHREQDLHVLILEDGVSSKVFQWLSKFFYKDLLVDRLLCVVATGHAPPVVATASLINFFKSQPLLPLAPSEVAQVLAAFKFPARLQAQLAELSVGHPASLAGAVTTLQTTPDIYDWLDGQGGLTPLGLGKIAEAMAQALLKDISPTLARCCLLISPLRFFRYDTLAALLPALMPDDAKYGRAGVVDYMLLGKELNDRIDFIESDKTYVMHPIARTILSNAVKLSDSATFRQINEEACRYYAALLERLEKPEQRIEALLEELYHRLLLAQQAVNIGNQPSAAAIQEVEQVLQKRLLKLGGRDGNRRLISLLENDRDLPRLFPGELDSLLQMLYQTQLR